MASFWGRSLLAASAAVAIAASLGGVGSPALANEGANRAAGVHLADPELTACVNAKLGASRAPDAPIMQAEIEGITVMTCNGDFAVTSLEGFEAANDLRTLAFLGGRHDLSGSGVLRPLTTMPKLSSLTLTDANLTDASLGVVSGAGKLSRLTVVGNPKLTTLEPLATMTSLTTLDASRNAALSDFEALAKLRSLRDLTISQNPLLTDLAPLAGLTELSYLNAQMTGIDSLAPLSELTKLTSISATHTQVSSLEPLAKLTALSNLSMSRAQLTSLAGIENAAALKTLEIDHNSDLGDNITAIGNKPLLYRIHMDAIGATTLAPLRELAGLKSLQAMGNHIQSLEGLPAAPGSRSDGTMAVTAQQIHLEDVWVPRGAKRYRADVSGELALRDGITFPRFGGNQAPVLSPDLPYVDITVYSAIPTAEYTFSETNELDNDRYTGTVYHPIVWSTITSEDSATLTFQQPWEQQTTYTQGFPAASFELVPRDGVERPDWLQIDAEGKLSGTPDTFGEWAFDLRVADALGNTMTQRLDIAVADPGTATVELSHDQTVAAGGSATFTVTRANDGYAGAASVTVATQDGAAGDENPARAGVHYTPLAETLSWADGDTSPREVTVATLETAAGDPDRSFTLELAGAEPAGLVAIGAGGSTDVTIVAPTPVPNELNFTGPQRAEGGESLTFEVSRSRAAEDPWTGVASVQVSTADVSALAGTHYEETTATLEWGPNDFAAKQFVVPTLAPAAGDPERNFAVELSEPSTFAALGKVSSVTGTITAPAPELTVFALNGDQQGIAGETLSFEVSRVNATQLPWEGETSVVVETVDGSAEGGTHFTAVAPTTLTWEAGDTDSKTVTVATERVAAGDPDRTFQVRLSEPGAYGEFGSPSEVEGVIVAEVPDPSLLAVVGEPEVRAGEAAVFTVTRTDAAERTWTGPVTVRVRTQDGTAHAGTHFTPVDVELSWEAGDDSSQQVEVPTTPGFRGDESRQLTLEISAPSEHAVVEAGASTAVGTISYAKLTPVDPDPDADPETDPGTETDPGSGGGDGSGGGTSAPRDGLAATGGPGIELPLMLGGAALLAGSALLLRRKKRA
ncbi:Calx-beta domain-containing protein [Leucobacter chromiireducens]|uniref:Gram-positive cocci surface proteins LPxTG domain-containing protein n=1 Tax=Leucobacter chromiireducens subsp. chromiireducens TaxID=660067 RepID=A0ABS1STB9_9MICO|nr:Calx-beta domain-containing protein [Leucobacter chromiireducens]MBL3690860.1 hypothetical protein [Leucobacter chromiireducens subsp. chromiireducens]